MIINKLILVALLALLLSGCSQGDNNFSEIRTYSVEGSNDPEIDSIWVDTVYTENKLYLNKNSLSLTIQRIDSTIARSLLDSTSFHNITLHVKDTVLFEKDTLIRYVAEYPIEYGNLSFYGIHLLGFGTVYWRWLDGRKSLLIKESKSSAGKSRRDFRTIREYLKMQLNRQMKDSIVIDISSGLPDSVDLNIDSTLFNPSK